MSLEGKDINAMLSGAMELAPKKTVVQPPVEQQVRQQTTLEFRPEGLEKESLGLVIEKPKTVEVNEDPLTKVEMNSGVGGRTLETVSAYLEETESEAEKVKRELEARGIDLEGYDLNDPYASQAHMTKLMNGGGPEVESAGEAVVIPGVGVIGEAGKKVDGSTTKEEYRDLDIEDEEENEYDPDEMEAKYREAVVIIDKAGMGKIINFTDEERAKMEKSQVIKVKEIEDLEIKTKSTKKVFNKKLGKILAKKAKGYTTNIVLPGSGYTAEISSCSTYELLSLVLSENTEKDKTLAAQKKWSVIHSKLVSTSIGKMDFTEFLKHTNPRDYETFIYGILVATYGGQTKTLPFNCERHEPMYEFQHKMEMRELMRAERMSERTMELVTGIVDNSYNVTDAKAYHDLAPVMKNKIIQLPDSEYIVELQVQNAYDNINKTIELVEELEKEDKFKARLAGVAASVARILIPDEEDPEVPFEVTNQADITDVLYSLRDTDIAILTNKAGELNEDVSLQYGALNVICDKCGHVTPFIPLAIESLLFYMVSQSQNKKVESDNGTK